MTDARFESAYVVPCDHPAFDGHFPGRPLLPGVVLLAEALAAIAERTGQCASRWTLENAKFVSPVTPGTALTIAQDDQAHGRVRFEIRAGTRTVASGVVAPGDSAP